MRFLAFLLALLMAAAPAAAAAADPSPAFAARAAELSGLFQGGTEPATLFSPTFLAQVPADQVKAVSSQLRGAYGAPRGVVRIEARSGTDGTILFRFERATLRLEMAIGPEPSNLIEGLLVAGAEPEAAAN